MPKKYKHINAKFGDSERYTSVGGGPLKTILPDRNPQFHSDLLLSEINTAKKQFEQKLKQAKVRPLRPSFLFSVKTEPDSPLKITSLQDKKGNKVEIVGYFKDTKEVLLETKDLDLKTLSKKIYQYAKEKTNSEKNPRPKNEDLVASVSGILIPDYTKLISQELLDSPDTNYWVELEAKGGEFKSEQINKISIKKMTDYKKLFNLPVLESYKTNERLYFFTKLSANQIIQICSETECEVFIYHAKKASVGYRNWLTFKVPQKDLTENIKNVLINPPSKNASVVTILDSGIAEEHPLLSGFVNYACSVIPSDNSVGDWHGHGTQMAGTVLYNDLSKILEAGLYNGEYFLESATIYHPATSNDEKYWPVLMNNAIEKIEENNSNAKRVYITAVTNENPPGEVHTRWSQSLDKLAYGDGNKSRLLCVSIGNTKKCLASGYVYKDTNLEETIDDPAQSINALTIGAYTELTDIIPVHAGKYQPVAEKHNFSPFTRANDFELYPIKPEIVFEGGNAACDKFSPSEMDSLSLLTTCKDFTKGQFLSTFNGTSCSTALAGQFIAKLINNYPDYKPETIRGLVVHSAKWSNKMNAFFPSNANGKNEKLALCGYGIPNLDYALNCTNKKATIVIEDIIRNDIDGEGRFVKYFKLPFPKYLYQKDLNAEVAVSMTLSYFAEPNETAYAIKSKYRGLDLSFDIQRTNEKLEEFKTRCNGTYREKYKKANQGKKFKIEAKDYNWEIGKQRREKGTIQSDRFKVNISEINEDSYIGVFGQPGWWDKEKQRRKGKMHFSLIVTVELNSQIDMDIYNYIEQKVAVPIPVSSEVEIPIK